MPRLHTYYDNLKVPRTASPEAIRAAYRRLSQKHHPDRNPDNPESARVMVLLNIAYRALSDPAKRAEHDRWIAQQEAAAEARRPQWQEPQAPPSPPPPPRRPHSPPKYRPTERDGPYFSETARQGIRIAFVLLASLMIGVPVLASIATLWDLPPMPADRPASRPVPRAIPHTPQSNLLVPNRLVAALRQSPDPSGIYRLIGSDIQDFNDNPRVYNKGKLVIRKLNERTYVVLEAVTVRGAGTFGHGHAYRIYQDGAEPGKVRLVGRSGSRIIGDAESLVQHTQGGNFKETLWWKREPDGFSEKYLDRGIEQAEWSYRVLVERGVERGG